MNREAAARRLAISRSIMALSSASPSFEKASPRFRRFEACGRRLHVDDIAGLFDVHGEGQDLVQAAMIALAEFVGIERGEIGFDRRVQLIEDIVEPLMSLICLRSPSMSASRAPMQHRLQGVGETQRFARRGAERDDGRFPRGGVEIERP